MKSVLIAQQEELIWSTWLNCKQSLVSVVNPFCRDGSNLYLIWSAWFDLKIYLVPSFAWFGLIWRFKYLGLIWLEQFENCKCLTWLGLVFKYLKKAWAWSFDFLKGLIWLEKYKPESNLQPRIIITEKLWIFYFCILLDVILRSICNFNTSFFN